MISFRINIAFALVTGLAVYACGDSKSDDDGTGGAGGSGASGGSSGGVSGTGGSKSSTGGASDTGGAPSNGGSSNMGGASDAGGAPDTAGSAGVSTSGAAGDGGVGSGTAGTSGETGGKPSGTGGTVTQGGADAGGAGAGGTDGGAGASSSGGTSSTGGASSGGTAGTGGAPACGTLGATCCAGTTCNGALSCLNGVSCSCLGGAKALFGRYVLRTDGVALYEAAGANGAQTPVLNAATGLPLADVIDVADGQYHGCAVVSGGSVWCWRTTSANGNRYGQVGNGTTDTSGAIFRATQVLTAVGTPLTNAKAMSIHANQSSPCAVMNDGKMYCWGALGWAVNNGTALYSGYAQAITTDGATPFTGVLQAANSAWQFCAVKSGASANEVWCWGYNAGNNLGLGDTTARHYPTKLVGLTKPSKVVVHQVASVSSGGACALDGANVRCWGNNSYGQIGNHTSTAVTGPTTVLVGDGATAFGQALDVFGGNANFCALRSGGTLWCWGNGFGNFAESYGVTNIVAGGWADDPRFLTSDGAYHIGALIRTPNCASL